jgi:hypothetical protein
MTLANWLKYHPWVWAYSVFVVYSLFGLRAGKWVFELISGNDGMFKPSQFHRFTKAAGWMYDNPPKPPRQRYIEALDWLSVKYIHSRGR